MKWVGVVMFALLSCLVGPTRRAGDAGAVRTGFDADPGWDGHRNRLVPDPPPVTRQDFGWRDTNHAGGKERGEIGGRVQRSTTPASYAMPIAPRTLKDRLHASGRFAVTADDGGSGLMLGWFNHDSRGWRTPNSLGLRLDGNGGRGYWVFYEYGTRSYFAHGGGAFEGERYQTTPTEPFKPDGTSHAWSLDYDPAGNEGGGVITFVIDDRTYALPLQPGHRADGATFDRFGIWNVQTTGGGIEAYFDDVAVGGRPLDFTADPGWVGSGNDVEFADRVRRPFHDFGFSPTTRHAGGKAAGEVGGITWRDESPAYYADRLEPLDLDRELVASGTLAFRGAGSDSAVWIGWFDSKAKREKATPEHEQPQPNLLGILIEGPSRVGHYFRPGYRADDGQGATADTGPIIRPDGKVHRWSLHYRPQGAGGNGQIEVTLDDRTQTLDIRPGDRQRGATFDRFGLFNVQSGGHFVEVYLDDLAYTGRRVR